uniref:Uncharacterized protein n=1 Tax=Triticum urartu TaxID=4572 RepID=A0A8R7Q412_TRIUA
LVPPANSALPPPTNSTATLHVASKKAIWTGFDGAYGPRTQSDGDFGRGPLLLIANNSNPGRALHCLVFEKDTASYCPSKSRHGNSSSEIDKDTEEAGEDWRRRTGHSEARPRPAYPPENVSRSILHQAQQGWPFGDKGTGDEPLLLHHP